MRRRRRSSSTRSDGSLPPVFMCFRSTLTQTKTLELLNAQRTRSEPFDLTGRTVRAWSIGTVATVYEAVFDDVQGARPAFVAAAVAFTRLPRFANCNVLLFDHRIDQLPATAERTYVVDNLGILDVILGTQLTAQQSNDLRMLLLQDHQPRRVPVPVMPGVRSQAYADAFFEAMREGRHLEPPPADLFSSVMVTDFRVYSDFGQGIANEAYDAAAFERAQTESMAAPAPAPPRREPIPTDWERVLKQAVVARPHDPCCIVCTDNRATICFVECGHQIMCDDCVRTMCQTAGVRRECPSCRAPMGHLIRPMMAGQGDGQNE